MPRNHYPAQAAIAALLSLILAEAARRRPLSARTTTLLFGAWVAWAFVSATVLRQAFDRHDANRIAVARQRDYIARVVRTHPEGSVVCVRNEHGPGGIGFPGTVGVFMLDHPGNHLEGRRVYFVSSSPELLNRRHEGGRLESLLLPADACPPRDARARSTD